MATLLVNIERCDYCESAGTEGELFIASIEDLLVIPVFSLRNVLLHLLSIFPSDEYFTNFLLHLFRTCSPDQYFFISVAKTQTCKLCDHTRISSPRRGYLTRNSAELIMSAP